MPVIASTLSTLAGNWSSMLVAQARAFVHPVAIPRRTAPFLHSGASAQGYWNAFVIASLPAWIIGLWSVGHQANLAIAQLGLRALPGWQAGVLTHLGVGFEAASPLACFLHGLLWFIPIFAVALLTGAAWQALFSAVRNRPPDPGLIYACWFFTLMLPAGTPLYQAALGISFGLVFGKLIFGGSGRYLFNPALLGVAFLVFSYPDLVFGEGNWVPVPGYDQPTVLELVSDEGGLMVITGLDYDWTDLFVGDRPGAFGTTSVLGILLGAAWLVWTGVASWRVLLGAMAGMIMASLVFNMAASAHPLFALPWYWHGALGGFAFGLVFIATDPVAGATTRTGRWGFGLLVGALTVVIRLANPSYHEGVMFSILLASTFAPLIDWAVVARHIAKRQRAPGAHP